MDINVLLSHLLQQRKLIGSSGHKKNQVLYQIEKQSLFCCFFIDPVEVYIQNSSLFIYKSKYLAAWVPGYNRDMYCLFYVHILAPFWKYSCVSLFADHKARSFFFPSHLLHTQYIYYPGLIFTCWIIWSFLVFSRFSSIWSHIFIISKLFFIKFLPFFKQSFYILSQTKEKPSSIFL